MNLRVATTCKKNPERLLDGYLENEIDLEDSSYSFYILASKELNKKQQW